MCAALQVMKHSLAITLFIIGGSGILVGHAEAQCGVKQNRQLSGGRGNRLGFSCAGRKSAVERTQRGLRPPDVNRSDAQ